MRPQPTASPPIAGLGARFAALGAGEIVARLAAFALTIVLARRLGPAAYGIVGVVMGVMLYLTQVADAGIELVGVPLVARARGSVGMLASPILTYRLLFALALTALVIPAGIWLLPQPDGTLLAISAFALPCTALGVRWILLGLDRTVPIAVARVAGEVVALLLTLWLVHEAGDLVRVPMAQVAGAAVTMVLLRAAATQAGVTLVPRYDWASAKPVFERSRHLLGFTLLGLVLFNLDLIVLRWLRGPEPAGWYAAAYTLIAFAANLFVSFSQAALPMLARVREHARESADAYGRVAAQAMAVAIPVAVGGAIAAPGIVALVFGDRFAPAVPALQWLLASVPFSAMREVATAGLVAAHGERALLRTNAAAVVTNVALIAVLIPRWGLLGAAAATVVTEIVRLAIVLHHAHAAGLVVALRRFWRPVAASAAMAAALAASGAGEPWVVVPVGALVYGVVLAALGGVRRGAGGGIELHG